MFVTLYAENGGLEIRGDEFKLLAGNIKTADDVADAIQKLNIDLDFDDIYSSSSMDFASEEGFDTDNGAKDLFNAGVRRWYKTVEVA